MPRAHCSKVVHDQPQSVSGHNQPDIYCYEADISEEPEDLSLNTSKSSSDGKY